MAAILSQKKKTPWPKLPIRVKAYKINKNKEIDKEKGAMSTLWLGNTPFRRHDPLKIMENHGTSCTSWKYKHEKDDDEQKYCRILNLMDVSQQEKDQGCPKLITTPPIISKGSKSYMMIYARINGYFASLAESKILVKETQ